MVDERFPLFHGTTARAAAGIVRDGWQAMDPAALVRDVALAHGVQPELVWEELRTEPQAFLHGDDRGGVASFCLRFGVAAHEWAQRAPEARREALWSIWRLQNPDRARDWTTQVDGHLWVLAHLVDDAPAVIEIQVSYAELMEWRATGASNGHTNKLPPRELLLHPDVHFPEIAIGVPLWFPKNEMVVHPVERHVDWDLFAALLGMDRDTFIGEAERGALGPKGRGGAGAPWRGTAWWPLTQVVRVLRERGRPVEWSRCCQCLTAG